jgi:hypothetical protein
MYCERPQLTFTQSTFRSMKSAVIQPWTQLRKLFLGAQLSWNMRPFIGSPDSDVQFLRDKPLFIIHFAPSPYFFAARSIHPSCRS